VEGLRVVTLNIWNRNGPWEERRRLIREGLERLCPDIVGLQEVLRMRAPDETADQAEQIVGDLGWNVAYAAGHELVPGLDFGNAVVSRHPILEHERVELPGGESSDQRRSVLHATVDSPCGPVPVFVTHLNWKLHEGAVRVEQVRFLADLVQSRAPVGETYPPVIMGDLNAEPGSDEVRFLQGLATIGGRSVYFADVHRCCGQGPGHSFHPRNPYAAQVHEPPRRIDYVFVRGPDTRVRGKPLAARVVFDEPENEVWPSDHFGVLADLSTGT